MRNFIRIMSSSLTVEDDVLQVMEGELSVRYDSSAHGVLSVHDMRNASRRTPHSYEVERQIQTDEFEGSAANSP